MRNPDASSPPLDVVIIGGGPAGLQAALTLGRMRYRVALFDSGEYRNGTVAHAHNLVTNDGRPPSELRRIARDELAAYDTVEVRDARVADVVRADGGFCVVTAHGETATARRLLLATGMHDDLPDVPGLAELWGREVAQCPFCHGYELRGRPVALVGAPPHAAFQEAMLRRIASTVTVLAPDSLASIERIGEGSAGVGAGSGVRLHLVDGSEHEAAGLFLAATPRQAAPFAERLGCGILPSGSIEIDAQGRATVAGVYAAGDMAHQAAQPGPMVSLAGAIAAGQLAAVGVVRDALEDV